jgi:hypothetical protein
VEARLYLLLLISSVAPCREEVSISAETSHDSILATQFSYILLITGLFFFFVYFILTFLLSATTADQDTCDASKDEEGKKCVWCSIASFGVCVSEDIAEKMKGQIPGLECDDDDNTDDDQAPTDDDKTDDNTTPNDDTVPDDYWNCLKKYDDATNCTTAGCAWCVS